MIYEDTELKWQSYGHQLAKNIRYVRQKRNMTQEDVALITGLSRNVISNLERNDNNGKGPNNPTLLTIYRIARALGVMPLLLLPSPTRRVSDVCENSGPETSIDFHWPGGQEISGETIISWVEQAELEPIHPQLAEGESLDEGEVH